MAALLFKSTIAEWYASVGVGSSSVTEKLLLEILNQQVNPTSSDMTPLYGTTDGTADFQNDFLIGKNVSAVWVDGVLLTPTTDYTVNAGTGTITFVNVPITGLTIYILYTA